MGLIEVDSVVVQFREELLEGCEKGLVAVVNLRIRLVREIVPFHILCKRREGGLRVITAERFRNASNNLHVLLRHRLLREAEIGERVLAVEVEDEPHHLAAADVE